MAKSIVDWSINRLRPALTFRTHFNSNRAMSLSSPALAASFVGQHVLSARQFTRDHLNALFATADECQQLVSREGSSDALKGKLLATLFYESSTRTSCSFQAAMLRLGGKVMTLNDTASSSVSKGETLQDTVRCLESYADIIVQRHPQEGSAKAAAAALTTAVLINAGDGVGEHPTQALLDLYTIQRETPTHCIDNLTVTLVGDLKNGRTVHSLAQALTLYNNVTLNYVSPAELRMPQSIQDEVKLRSSNIKQCEHTSLDSVLSQTDILYVTRVQKERFESQLAYDKVAQSFCITTALLKQLNSKSTLRILHPLPRVTELSSDVDSDTERAAYFRQMRNGMYVRMALLCWVTGRKPRSNQMPPPIAPERPMPHATDLANGSRNSDSKTQQQQPPQLPQSKSSIVKTMHPAPAPRSNRPSMPPTATSPVGSPDANRHASMSQVMDQILHRNPERSDSVVLKSMHPTPPARPQKSPVSPPPPAR